MFGLARRGVSYLAIAGVLGVSWASVSALTSKFALPVQVPSLRQLVAGVLPKESEQVTVLRVVDGDTFVAKVDGRRRKIRLNGVDTPESKKPNTPVQCFAQKASHFTSSHLTGERVKLTFDVDREDKYGRVLAYVDFNGQDFGERLVRRGLAKALTIPPNMARSFTYERGEREARKADRGLWAACE